VNRNRFVKIFLVIVLVTDLIQVLATQNPLVSNCSNYCEQIHVNLPASQQTPLWLMMFNTCSTIWHRFELSRKLSWNHFVCHFYL